MLFLLPVLAVVVESVATGFHRCWHQRKLLEVLTVVAETVTSGTMLGTVATLGVVIGSGKGLIGDEVRVVAAGVATSGVEISDTS